jgi:CheY-like chemotaxis protein
MPNRILIADDDTDVFLPLLERRLKRNGYEIITAQTGTEALEKAEKEKPDLIVLDIMMPPDKNKKVDINEGLKICRKLKNSKNETVRNIPVAFLTLRAGEEVKKASEEVGGLYLPKSFDANSYLNKIAEILPPTYIKNKEK